MKNHYALFLVTLSLSTAFAQTSIVATYVDVLPQNNAGEGGEIYLEGSNGNNAVLIDNWFGNARIFGFASGKQLQVLGGSIYSDGVGVNYFEGRVGIGTSSPRQKLEVGSSSNPAINIHDFTTAELTIGVNESLVLAQFNTNSGGFRFVTGQDGINFPGTGSEIVRFSASGNVGIGTTAPAAKLELHSDAPASLANLMLTSGQDRTPRIRFNGPWSVVNPTESYAQIEAINDNGGPGNSAASLHFFTSSGDPAFLSDKMMITGTGNVGIGTTNPTHKLAVNGTIKAKEVIVETTGWSDYVFADDYALAPLAEVEAHIKEHKHLPGIPSAAQVADQGVSLGDMQAKLLAKIEELTLHVIAQEKRADQQAALASEQAKEIAALRAQVSSSHASIP